MAAFRNYREAAVGRMLSPTLVKEAAAKQAVRSGEFGRWSYHVMRHPADLMSSSDHFDSLQAPCQHWRPKSAGTEPGLTRQCSFDHFWGQYLDQIVRMNADQESPFSPIDIDEG